MTISNGAIKITGGLNFLSPGLLILPVGDSITYGTANGNFGYRGTLQDLLGGTYRFVGRYHHPNSGQTRSVFHEGLQVGDPNDNTQTGYTASMNTRGRSSMLLRFPGTPAGSIVLFHGGTNNVKQEPGGFLPEAAAIDQIADNPLTTASFLGWAVQAFPTVKLYVALIIPSPNAANDAAFTSYNAALNTRLQLVQAIYPQVIIVDMNSAFKLNPTWATDYMADTLHPTSAGYDVMAQTWYSCIQSSLNTFCNNN